MPRRRQFVDEDGFSHTCSHRSASIGHSHQQATQLPSTDEKANRRRGELCLVLEQYNRAWNGALEAGRVRVEKLETSQGDDPESDNVNGCGVIVVLMIGLLFITTATLTNIACVIDSLCLPGLRACRKRMNCPQQGTFVSHEIALAYASENNLLPVRTTCGLLLQSTGLTSSIHF